MSMPRGIRGYLTLLYLITYEKIMGRVKSRCGTVSFFVPRTRGVCFAPPDFGVTGPGPTMRLDAALFPSFKQAIAGMFSSNNLMHIQYK